MLISVPRVLQILPGYVEESILGGVYSGTHVIVEET